MLLLTVVQALLVKRKGHGLNWNMRRVLYLIWTWADVQVRSVVVCFLHVRIVGNAEHKTMKPRLSLVTSFASSRGETTAEIQYLLHRLSSKREDVWRLCGGVIE